MGIIIKTYDCRISDNNASSFINMILPYTFAFVALVAMGPTAELVVRIRATVSLAATARRSMEAIIRALKATPAPITREDMAVTANPSQVMNTLGVDQSVNKSNFSMSHFSQVDTDRRRLIKEEAEEVVAMVVPVSPIAPEPITTTTTSHPA